MCIHIFLFAISAIYNFGLSYAVSLQQSLFSKFDLYLDDEHQGGRFFFRALKEGDNILFASEEDIDRQHWVYKLYNATGQSFKPTAPKIDMAASSSGSDALPRPEGKRIVLFVLFLNRLDYLSCAGVRRSAL